MKYDPVNDNFTTFESVKTPKVEVNDPLYGMKTLDWADKVLDNGVIIAKPVTEPEKMVNSNPEYQEPPVEQQQQQQNKKINANDNEKFVINTLMDRLGLSNYQAAGIAGVIMSESGFKHNIFNKAEKSGKLPSSKANGSGYGAGYLQWSMGRKNQALKLIGKEGSNIEDLSPEDQVEMIIKELEGPYKNTLEGIRKSKNAREAAATMYCHNVAGYSSSKNPATQEEIDRINSRYSRFTGPTNLVVDRAMKYAEKYL